MPIRWIPGHGMYANAYIAGSLLVDAGVSPTAVEPYRDEIELIVLTHGHHDHTAYVRELAHLCDARVAIHEEHPSSCRPGSRTGGVRAPCRVGAAVFLQPGVQVGLAEPPLPPHPDGRQLPGLQPAVDCPEVYIQILEDFLGGQELIGHGWGRRIAASSRGGTRGFYGIP